MLVLKVILRRLTQKLGPTLLCFVVVPIGFLVRFNVLMWIAAYVECRTLENPVYWNRTPNPGRVC
jgi:hypothetical protein